MKRITTRERARLVALSQDIKENLKAIDNLLFLTNQNKRKMEIYNTTTGKTESLSIIDRKTGLDWVNDLLGNHGAPNYNRDEERYEMLGEDIDWWQNIIDGLNEIEDLKEQAEDILSYDDFEDLKRKLEDEGNADDLECHVSILTKILNEVIKNNAI